MFGVPLMANALVDTLQTGPDTFDAVSVNVPDGILPETMTDREVIPGNLAVTLVFVGVDDRFVSCVIADELVQGLKQSSLIAARSQRLIESLSGVRASWHWR